MSNNVANSREVVSPGRAMFRSALLDPLFVNTALVFSLTLMFTVSDAFETQSLAMLHSITLWAVVSLLMVLQTCISHRLFLSFFSATRLSRLLAAGLALLATVLLMSGELHLLKFTPLLPKEPDPLLEFIFFVAQPVFAAGCLTLLSQTDAIQRYVDLLQNRDQDEAKGGEDCSTLDAILRQHEIVHVSAQDHYLQIVCTQQSFFVRGRMKDALALLAQRDGVQVHRSHWVASAHVELIRRQGRDMRLLMSDGTEVPVSRSRAQSLDWQSL
ncbi:MAG: hypothetical protein DHS20C12_25810 [Pseudohongiella sp.]|nr:MAG: hypothetical protein DHS20C12_25810 [Pseudohongiella sp.]